MIEWVKVTNDRKEERHEFTCDICGFKITARGVNTIAALLVEIDKLENGGSDERD